MAKTFTDFWNARYGTVLSKAKRELANRIVNALDSLILEKVALMPLPVNSLGGWFYEQALERLSWMEYYLQGISWDVSA